MFATKKNCYWHAGDPVTLDPVCKTTYWIQLFSLPYPLDVIRYCRLSRVLVDENDKNYKENFKKKKIMLVVEDLRSARYSFFILLVAAFITFIINSRASVHAFQVKQLQAPKKKVISRKNLIILKKGTTAKNNNEQQFHVISGRHSSGHHLLHMKRSEDDDNDDEYNDSDIIDTILEFIEGTSIPLLPNTKPISIVYPLTLSALSLILPLSTTLFLDFGFALFLYLGRSLAVADNVTEISGDHPSPPKMSLLLSDFAALVAALVFAGLLSPQGLGTASITPGGGGSLEAIGATSLLAGLSAVLSAITVSTSEGEGGRPLVKKPPSNQFQKKDKGTTDSDYNEYSEEDRRVLKQWDEKYNEEKES